MQEISQFEKTIEKRGLIFAMRLEDCWIHFDCASYSAVDLKLDKNKWHGQLGPTLRSSFSTTDEYFLITYPDLFRNQM